MDQHRTSDIPDSSLESSPDSPAESHAEASEKHPAARLAETLARLPSYLRLARRLLGDRRLGRLRKGGLGAGIAYLASPIDLIPGVVPVFGQLDDLVAILLAIRFALRGLPGPAADALLANVGLSRDLMSRDLANVRAAAVWAARGTARVGGRVALAGVSTAAGTARLGVRVAKTGLSAVAAAARLGARAVSRAPTRRLASRALSMRRR